MLAKQPLPTDLQILDTIYNCYYDTFRSWTREKPTRQTKNYVAVNNEEIARLLGVDVDIIFSRLYYHLEHKYGFTWADGSSVNIFRLKLGEERGHFVNFPYMAAILADLRHENKKFATATWIALAALVVSAAALFVSIFM